MYINLLSIITLKVSMGRQNEQKNQLPNNMIYQKINSYPEVVDVVGRQSYGQIQHYRRH